MLEKFINPEELKIIKVDVVQETVMNRLTEEQLIQMKNEFFKTSQQLHTREDAWKRLKKFLENDFPSESIVELLEELSLIDFGDVGSKRLKDQFNFQRSEIDLGYRSQKTDLFLVPDFETLTMGLYLPTGELHLQRPLRPEEMQSNIHSISKVK